MTKLILLLLFPALLFAAEPRQAIIAKQRRTTLIDSTPITIPPGATGMLVVDSEWDAIDAADANREVRIELWVFDKQWKRRYFATCVGATIKRDGGFQTQCGLQVNAAKFAGQQIRIRLIPSRAMTVGASMEIK